MIIPFVGGPYDGMRLSAFEIERIATLFSIMTTRGLRKFGTFPHLQDWPDVLSGKLNGTQARAYYYYELVNTVLGPQHQYDPGGRRYREALAEAI